MSKLRRLLTWKPAVAALLIGAGTSAQAQVLRGQYVGAGQERFGWACADTGDVDGDGTDDFIVGSRSTSIATSRDGTLLVIPQLTLVLPLPANGLTLSDTLPNDPLVYFLDIYLQALEVDTFATKGLSFTPGLQLHCGFDLP